MMQNINKELRIRSRVSVKVYHTIWKLLFRSQMKLEESFITDLLLHMKHNVSIKSFEEFIRTIEILNYLSAEYPEFEDQAKTTLISIEEKHLSGI